MGHSPVALAALAGASESLALVIVPGRTLRWGLPSSAVLGAHAPADWAGAAPLDWEELVGAPAPSETEQVRILVLKTELAELAVRVRGAIEIATVEASDVLPLPTHLLGDEVAAAHGICFSAAGSPLLVLNVNRIGHRRC